MADENQSEFRLQVIDGVTYAVPQSGKADDDKRSGGHQPIRVIDRADETVVPVPGGQVHQPEPTPEEKEEEDRAREAQVNDHYAAEVAQGRHRPRFTRTSPPVTAAYGDITRLPPRSVVSDPPGEDEFWVGRYSRDHF